MSSFTDSGLLYQRLAGVLFASAELADDQAVQAAAAGDHHGESRSRDHAARSRLAAERAQRAAAERLDEPSQ